MDLNDLRVFSTVVEAKSFSAAARALGLPKSSVSRAVARLEAHVGVQLLRRTTRRVHLTDSGQSLFARCHPALFEIDEAERDVREAATAVRGPIRLTAPGDVAQEILAPLVLEFVRTHPEVSLDLELTTRTVDLLEEGFDFAVRAGVLADPSLVSTKLYDATVSLVASRAYLDRHGRPTRVEDLERHECILFGGARAGGVWELMTTDGPRRVRVRGRLSTNEIPLIKRFLLGGAGIAWLPDLEMVDALASGALERVLPGVCPMPGQVWLVFPPGRRIPHRVRLLVDFLKQRLRNPAAS